MTIKAHNTPEPTPRHGQPIRDLVRISYNQIQYRSYQQTVQIYHFRTCLLSVPQFTDLLMRYPEFGYLDTLVGPDTQISLFRPAGDEVPEDCIEVAYLPNVMTTQPKSRHHGHALGFRIPNGHNNTKAHAIKWFLFDRPIQAMILESWVRVQGGTATIYALPPTSIHDTSSRVFDRVAELWKGTKEKVVRKAFQEHFDWHGSLLHATTQSRHHLKLTWDAFPDLYREQAKARRIAVLQDMHIQN
ncbi:hypothetical protein ACEQ8H_000475 [Pleosporales sp. CAS-2024a]